MYFSLVSILMIWDSVVRGQLSANSELSNSPHLKIPKIIILLTSTLYLWLHVPKDATVSNKKQKDHATTIYDQELKGSSLARKTRSPWADLDENYLTNAH